MKNSTLNNALRKPQLIISFIEALLHSLIKVLLLIKDQYALHQWKLERKYQEMRPFFSMKCLFKAATLKSALETPTAKISKHLTMAFKMEDEY